MAPHQLLPSSQRFLWWPQLFFIVEYLTAAFAVPLLHSRGATLAQMLIFFTLQYIVPVIQIPLVTRVHPRTVMPTFLILRGCAFLALAVFPTWTGIVAYGALYGLQTLWFWIPYNHQFFRDNKRRPHGVVASYVAIRQTIGVTVPLFGGFLVEQLGYHGAFFLGACLSALSAIPLGRLPWPSLRIDFKQGLREIRPIRNLLLLEGVFYLGIYLIIPLYAIFFISEPIAYGAYLSYVVLVGVVGTLTIGRWINRASHRRALAALLCFLTGGAIIALGFAQSKIAWIILSGALALLSILVAPLFGSIYLKNTRASPSAWAARDVMLNAGRSIGMVAMLACLWAGFPAGSIIAVGAIFLLYPIMFLRSQLKA